MDNKFIISDFYHGHILGFAFIDDELRQIYNLDKNSLIGNIYCGYVKDIVKNINAAFVDFYDGNIGFLPLKGMKKLPKTGDKILVQVAGDKIKTKDYLLTWKINLGGNQLALTVGNSNISVSKKITDSGKRDILKCYLEDYKNTDYGFILRTGSENSTKEEIVAQAEQLKAQYSRILKKFEFAAPKTLLYENSQLLLKTSEFVKKFGGQIITEHTEIADLLKKHDIPVLFNDENKISLCNKYALGHLMKEATSKNVWLKSGAYIVIEPTEAMTVIDVNTGKAEFHSSREKTFEKINQEAAKEIARQISIRNISGIIIIDFINMESPKNYDELLTKMKFYVSRDDKKCTVCGFTKLGLMEITRQKKEKPLSEIINEVKIK